MGKFKTSLTAMAVVLALGACSEQKAPQTTSVDTTEAPAMQEKQQFDNVLLQEFKGPYGGVPAFDKMKLEDLKPALEKAMELNLKEIDEIANNPEPPTFENVIVAMERSGSELSRVFRYYGIWSANKSSPEFRAIQVEMAPKLSAFSTKIPQNEKLFERGKAVYESEQLST